MYPHNRLDQLPCVVRHRQAPYHDPDKLCKEIVNTESYLADVTYQCVTIDRRRQGTSTRASRTRNLWQGSRLDMRTPRHCSRSWYSIVIRLSGLALRPCQWSSNGSSSAWWSPTLGTRPDPRPHYSRQYSRAVCTLARRLLVYIWHRNHWRTDTGRTPTTCPDTGTEYDTRIRLIQVKS